MSKSLEINAISESLRNVCNYTKYLLNNKI